MAIRPRSTRVSYILRATTLILATLVGCMALVPASRAQSSGSTKWVATFQNLGPLSGEAQPAAVATDSAGNVYVTGWATVSENFCPPPQSCTQALTIKYDPSGKVLWKDWLSTVNPPNQIAAVAQGMDIALDSTGNTYVLFNFTHPLAADPGQVVPEVVTAKYNSAGGRDWIEFIDSSREPGSVQRTPVHLAVSPEGNVYVTYLEGIPNTGPISGAVTKYDTAGHTIWYRSINDSGKTPDGNQPAAIALDALENIYVDVVLAIPPYSDGEIVKYDLNGNRLATFGRGQISTEHGFHVDPDGACYFSGRGANNGSPLPDLVVAKFNPDQSLAYLVDITTLENGLGADLGGGAGPDGGIGTITSDSSGDAFLLQYFSNTGPAFDGSVISVLKLDPSGKEVFATRYNNQSNESGLDSPTALAVSPLGDFYITGNVQLQPQSNDLEFVTLKYDSTGVQQWVAQYASPGPYAVPIAIALSAGNLIVTGTASSTDSPASEWVTIDYVP
jgi:hypothetical protein